MVVEEELNNKSKVLTFVFYIGACMVLGTWMVHVPMYWYGALDLVTTQPCPLVCKSMGIIGKKMF